jgi:hypothetical protein
MGLLDDENEIIKNSNNIEQEYIYKEFIDIYMGGKYIPPPPPMRNDFHYKENYIKFGKYGINNHFNFVYMDAPKFDSNSAKLTRSCEHVTCITPALVKTGEQFVLCSEQGVYTGMNNYGELIFRRYTTAPLCIFNYGNDKLEYRGVSIKLISKNIDDEIILFNCNPELIIPGFKIKRINY